MSSVKLVGTWKYWYSTVPDAGTVKSSGMEKVASGVPIVRFSLNIGGTANPTTTMSTANPIYGYGYVMADPNADCAAITPPPNGGDIISNSSALTVPIFIAGSLCIDAASPGVAEPVVEPGGVTQSVTLYVGGTFRTSNSGSPVGTLAKPIKSANIVHGCQAYFKKNWVNQACNVPGTPLNGTGSGVFATPPYLSQQVTLTKPTADPGTYSSATPGPGHNCNGASTMGLFKLDNDSNRNTSLQIPAGTGSVSLLHLKDTNQGNPQNNFDCQFHDGTGALVGQLKWVDGKWFCRPAE